jgi:hypothetical protein
MDDLAPLVESTNMLAKLKHLWRMESSLGEVFWLAWRRIAVAKNGL